MATIIVATIATICQRYSITRQQFDLATKIVDCNTNTAYYQVDSESNPGTAYNVKFNRQYGKLTCTCPAGERGINCKHKRSALANEEYFKAEQNARRQAEQAEVESTREYAIEQAIVELEDALDALDRIAAEADARDAEYERRIAEVASI